jgi:hypothetical protein
MKNIKTKKGGIFVSSVILTALLSFLPLAGFAAGPYDPNFNPPAPNNNNQNQGQADYTFRSNFLKQMDGDAAFRNNVISSLRNDDNYRRQFLDNISQEGMMGQYFANRFENDAQWRNNLLDKFQNDANFRHTNLRRLDKWSSMMGSGMMGGNSGMGGMMNNGTNGWNY